MCHKQTKSLPIALLYMYDSNLLAQFVDPPSSMRRFSGRDMLNVAEKEKGLVSSVFFHFAIEREFFCCQCFIPAKGMAKWTLMSRTPIWNA